MYLFCFSSCQMIVLNPPVHLVQTKSYDILITWLCGKTAVKEECITGSDAYLD